MFKLRDIAFINWFSFTILSAQAFHGAFEDFVTWLRETERKIQRDDPLKLEDGELKLGLKLLKVDTSRYIAAAPRPLYEILAVEPTYI